VPLDVPQAVVSKIAAAFDTAGVKVLSRDRL